MLPSSMSILDPNSIEIIWDQTLSLSQLQNDQKSETDRVRQNDQKSGPYRVRQIVRSLCPIPVLVVSLTKTPMEFGILALTPMDPLFKKCFLDSPLMTFDQKIDLIESLENGLESK